MRKQWLKLHFEKGLPITEIARISGFHQDTLYLWKAKYLEQGPDGLIDQSRAPHHHTNEYPKEVKEKIRLLRQEGLKKEKRYIGPKIIKIRLKKRFGITASDSGIGKFLNRDGLIPEKRKKKRRKKKKKIRKCRIHEPGEVLQVDVKYAFKSYSNHWFYQYSSIDYLTNIVYGNIYEVQSNLESIMFVKSLLRFYPFSISGLQTDNHSTFTNYYTGYLKKSESSPLRLHPLDLFCLKRNIKHYLIDKGKPAQNGKVERFHRTCEEDFYQKEIFKDLNSARKKFRDFLYYYNNKRENLGLKGLTPLEKLRTFPGYSKIKELIT